MTALALRAPLAGICLGLAACVAAGPPPPSADPLPLIERLENLREPGGQTLAGYLSHRRAHVRARAARALGRLGEPEATLPFLVKALEDGAPEVREEAAWALGWGHTPPTAQAARRALKSRLVKEQAPTVRALLAESLGRTGGAEELTVLTSALGNRGQDPIAVEGALRGVLLLAARGVPPTTELLQTLTEIVTEAAPPQRRWAWLALAHFARGPGSDLSATTLAPLVPKLRDAALRDERAEAHLAVGLSLLGALAARGQLNEGPLFEAAFEAGLAHPDWRVQVEGARGLAASGPGGWTALARALQRQSRPLPPSEAPLHPHALRAALEALLPHGSHPAVVAAARSLGNHCGALALLERAGQRAATLACDAPPAARRRLHAQVLGQLPGRPAGSIDAPPSPGQELAPPLDDGARLAEFAFLSRDPHPLVREAVALEARGLPGSGRLLAKLLDDAEPKVVAAAAEGLLALSSPPGPPGADLPSSEKVGAGALLALSRTRSDQDAATMVRLVDVLGQLGDPQALPYLRWAQRDPNPALRRSARRALARLTSGGDRGEAPAEGSTADRAPAAPPAPPPPSPGDPAAHRGQTRRMLFRTTAGDFEVTLFPEEAPYTVAGLLWRVERGHYRQATVTALGLGFPESALWLAPDEGRRGAGAGFTFRTEAGRRALQRYTVALWEPVPDTGQGSLRIALDDAPHLDGRYTVVGQISQGFETVERLTLYDTVLEAVVLDEK